MARIFGLTIPGRDLRYIILAAGGVSAPVAGFRIRDLDLRWPSAGVAQSVERVLGKDEVSGSNPDTSSIREHPRSRAAGRSAAVESAGLGGKAEHRLLRGVG